MRFVPLSIGIALATAAVAQTTAPRPTATAAPAQTVRPAPARGNMDVNGDGYLSRGEYVMDALNRFEQIDRNRDGRIDPSEWQARSGAPAPRPAAAATPTPTSTPRR